MDKRPSHISTFNGGMDRDTNFANMAKERYYELKNGRVVINNYSNSFSVTPFKQPSILIELTKTEPETGTLIIGSILIRDAEDFQIVIFTTNNSVDTLWLVKGMDTTISAEVIWSGDLGFDPQFLVEGVSKYETPHNIKIYFWDNLNPFRYCNIWGASYPLSLVPEDFDTIPSTALEQPKFDSITTGSYKAGKLQYAYRVYNNNGSVTNISPFSGMIHLTGPNMGETGISSSYMGATYQTVTTQGVKMIFDNLPTNTNKIKIYAIHYQTANVAPIVTIVVDTSYSGSEYILVDTGNVSGSVLSTVDELLFENYIPIPKTGVTKHNSLYLGDISKHVFNDDALDTFDCRAYRFDKNKTLVLTGAHGVNEVVTDINVSLPLIDKTADAIQIKDAQYANAYQWNTGVLGGTGINIDYEFFTKPILISASDSQTANPVYNLDELNTTPVQLSLNYPVNNSYSGYESVSIDYTNGGYCRDEVYAFAIVFRDRKGFKSFPRWIADIKFPAMRETGTGFADFNIVDSATTESSQIANILGITFTLKNIPALELLNPDIVSWEIVRMDRKKEDRSIVCQGLAFYLTNGSNSEPGTADPIVEHKYLTNNPFGTSLGDNWSTPVSVDPIVHNAFVTPDFYFENYKVPSIVSDSFNYIGNYTTHNYSTNPLGNLKSIQQALLLSLSGSEVLDEIVSVTSCLAGADKTVDADVTMMGYTNANIQPMTGFNWRGSLACIKTMNPLESIDDTPHPDYMCLYNIIRNNTNAYSGNTYTSRFNRLYYSTMNVQIINFKDSDLIRNVNVLGGDVYITMFDYLAQMFGYYWNAGGEGEPTWRKQHNIYFPVESVYNTAMRSGYIESKTNVNYGPVSDPSGGADKVCMESVGSYVDNGSSVFVQALPYYLYNTVYGQYPLYPVYIPKPELFDTRYEFDARIIYSNTKVTGEYIDSWLLFEPLNFKDLDYEYGPINKLIKFKDNVFSFQSKAMAAISINPRVALSGDSGIPIQMGSGSKLERFDYISTKYGCFHRFGAIDTEKALYFFDAFNKKLMVYSGGAEPLSDIKGMYSYINKEVPLYLFLDDIGRDSMISMHYDQINNDVLLRFNGYNPRGGGATFRKIVSYNELLNGFHSINEFNTYNYEGLILNSGKKLLVANLLQSGEVSNCNISEYDSMFDPEMDTELSVIINSSYTDRKVFDNLYFDIDIYAPDANKDINYVHTDYVNPNIHSAVPITNFIKSIQFYNDYQNTGVPELILKKSFNFPLKYNMSKVEREYMYQIQGNNTIDPSLSILDEDNLYTDANKPTFRDRMRGKYVVCKIIMKPSYDYDDKVLRTFALNYLKTLLRMSY